MVWCSHFQVWCRVLIRKRIPKQSRQSLGIPPLGCRMKEKSQHKLKKINLNSGKTYNKNRYLATSQTLQKSVRARAYNKMWNNYLPSSRFIHVGRDKRAAGQGTRGSSEGTETGKQIMIRATKRARIARCYHSLPVVCTHIMFSTRVVIVSNLKKQNIIHG